MCWGRMRVVDLKFGRLLEAVRLATVVSVALAVGQALEEDRRRRPFHYCILDLEMKLMDLPVVGRLIGFLNELRDRS